MARFTQRDEDAAMAKPLGLPAKEHPDTSLRMRNQILNPALPSIWQFPWCSYAALRAVPIVERNSSTENGLGKQRVPVSFRNAWTLSFMMSPVMNRNRDAFAGLEARSCS